MISEFTKHIKKRSINNTKLGKVLTKNDTTFTLRIGNTVITCDYSGELYVGEWVTVICPDGDFNKAYILSATNIGVGEGGNEVI